MKTKLFIDFGKRLGLDSKKSDGIVEEENQAIEKEFINMSINIRAIHATALKTANNIIEEVLRKEEFSKASKREINPSMSTLFCIIVNIRCDTFVHRNVLKR